MLTLYLDTPPRLSSLAPVVEVREGQRVAPSLDVVTHHFRIAPAECCRTSDNIFLSPVDIFRMSRADGMKV